MFVTACAHQTVHGFRGRRQFAITRLVNTPDLAEPHVVLRKFGFQDPGSWFPMWCESLMPRKISPIKPHVHKNKKVTGG